MPWNAYNRAVSEDPEGVRAVLQAAYDAEGIDPRELAWNIGIESGWRPDAVNPTSGAAGLIQFMPSTLRAMDAPTSAEVVRMTRRQQAPLIARFFFGIGSHLHALGDVYLAIFYPEALGKADDAVIGPVGSAIWRQNRGLREPNGGPVTVGSVRRVGTPPREGGPSLDWVKQPLSPESKKTSKIGLFVLLFPITPLVLWIATKARKR